MAAFRKNSKGEFAFQLLDFDVSYFCVKTTKII